MSVALVLVGYSGERQMASYESNSQAVTASCSAERSRIEVVNEDGKREIKNEQSLPSPGWGAG